MTDGWAAFYGAMFAGIATVIAYLVQARATRQQQLVSSAAQLAAVEYERELALVKNEKASLDVAPLAQYVAFHTAVLRKLQEGIATKEEITEMAKLYDVYYPGP